MDPTPTQSTTTTTATTTTTSAATTTTMAAATTTASTDDVKNRGWPKGKKRYPKSPGAPKQPLSGYVHFLNHRREAVRKANPDLSFAEISKKLASEWSNLDASTKSGYVEKAEQDKERYNREFSEYQTTQEYKDFIAAEQKKKAEKKQKSSSGLKRGNVVKKSANHEKDENGGDDGGISTKPPVFDIPIFTEEFLEHNKAREAELRLLKRQTTEFEEQNAVLQKHVENMNSAISKLERETSATEENNAILERRLDSLRALIVKNFNGVSLKRHDGNLCLENSDEYVQELNRVLFEEKDPFLTPKIKEIASRMDVSVYTGFSDR